MFLALAVLLAAASPAPYTDDAPLNAVVLVDAHEGWAVGCEGVILHTTDGGRSWEPQASGTRAHLQAVQFLTPYTGFAIGRDEQPPGLPSRGVLLTTRDGGLAWRTIPTPTVAGLHAVHFADDRRGTVAGDSTDDCPSGVWETRDGGRSWLPIPGIRGPGWRAGGFFAHGQAVLGGRGDRLTVLRNGKVQAADLDTLGGRGVLGVATENASALAVGAGGLVLLSNDSGGTRWGYANLGRPRDVAGACDFRAAAIRGQHRWAAGLPGSVVWHSADAGQTWELLPTGQTAPIRGLYFRDDKHGVAVGDLGTALLTTDGGKTWVPARRGGQRAALLAVVPRTNDAPLELLAASGLSDGYLCHTVAVLATDDERLLAATRRAGGCGCETLWPFADAGHLAGSDGGAWFAHWNATADDLVQQLALRIRVWQPEVFLLPGGTTPLDGLLRDAAKQARALAADPAWTPATQLAAPPWTVKRVATPAADGALRVMFDDASTEIASEARRLLNPDSQRLSALRYSAADPATGDLFSGIALAPGGTARRPFRAAVALDATQQEQARQGRIVQQLLAPDAATLAPSAAAHASLPERLAKLPDDQAARAGWQLVQQHARAGQYPLAAETARHIAERCPEQPEAKLCYEWLVRYSCSSEMRRRQELGQSLQITSQDVTPADAKGGPRVKSGKTGAEVTAQPLTRTVYEEQQQQLFSDAPAARRWYERGLELPPLGQKAGSLSPAAQVCFASARRQLGDWEPAKQWYQEYMQRSQGFAPGEPWRQAVAAELWLAQRSGPCPKKLAQCPRREERPKLDGSFDDACWQGVPAITLTDGVGSTSGTHATTVRFAFDPEYLYVAIEAKHPPTKPEPVHETRTRDGLSERLDRVELLLDLDRDYQTYYRFAVDQRGGLLDDCWGDRAWNPTWFVASVATADGYAAEIAIPRKELTGDALAPGRAWAMNATRVVPGKGVQVWSPPGDGTVRPESMGLLLFAAGAQRP